MKNLIKYIDLKVVTIIGLIIVILCLRSCKNDDGPIVKVDGKKYQVIKHKVDTVYVPTIQTVYKKGDVIYKEKPIYVQLPPRIDTVEVVKDYYSKVTYKDTLTLKDNLGYITLTDTIYQNKILGREWDSHINKVTIKDVSIVKELPKNEFYLGGLLGLNNKNGFTSVGPSVLLKTKKEKVFSVGVGLGPDKTIQYQGGIYIKLF